MAALLATGSSDRKARTWDAGTGKLRSHASRGTPTTWPAWRSIAAGQRLATASYDHSARSGMLQIASTCLATLPAIREAVMRWSTWASRP